MLYLLAATIAQATAPAPRALRFADCKPLLSLASAKAVTPQRREASPPKRPKPCMTLASA